MKWLSIGILMLAWVVSSTAVMAEDAKPVVAVFPIAGTGDAKLRERVWFSIRAKIDREGTYEVIDGVTMTETLGGKVVGYGAKEEEVAAIGRELGASVVVWGEVGESVLKMKLLDLRPGAGEATEVEMPIEQPTDVRFAAEKVVEMLAGVKPFTHPIDEAVTRDDEAERLWKEGENLVVNGGFDEDGKWWAIFRSEKYEVSTGNDVPPADRVAIRILPDGQRVLSMNLSKETAESNGLACLSESIRIEPDTRYRLGFRYRSEGPRLHLFVKGYTMARNINGQMVEREIYRRQVPALEPTAGKWVEVVDDLNPQHVAMDVVTLRVDLYTYLNAGVVEFDDIVLKKVGRQTRKAVDEAIDRPNR